MLPTEQTDPPTQTSAPQSKLWSGVASPLQLFPFQETPQWPFNRKGITWGKSLACCALWLVGFQLAGDQGGRLVHAQQPTLQLIPGDLRGTARLLFHQASSLAAAPLTPASRADEIFKPQVTSDHLCRPTATATVEPDPGRNLRKTATLWV